MLLGWYHHFRKPLKYVCIYTYKRIHQKELTKNPWIMMVNIQRHLFVSHCYAMNIYIYIYLHVYIYIYLLYSQCHQLREIDCRKAWNNTETNQICCTFLGHLSLEASSKLSKQSQKGLVVGIAKPLLMANQCVPILVSPSPNWLTPQHDSAYVR